MSSCSGSKSDIVIDCCSSSSDSDDDEPRKPCATKRSACHILDDSDDDVPAQPQHQQFAPRRLSGLRQPAASTAKHRQTPESIKGDAPANTPGLQRSQHSTQSASKRQTAKATAMADLSSGSDISSEDDSSSESDAEAWQDDTAADPDASDTDDVMDETARKAANVKAMLDNSLQVCRKPIASVLTVKGQETLRRAFRSPVPNAPDQSPALQQKLAARHRIRPWGGGQFKPALLPTVVGPFVPEETQSRDSRAVPDDGGPPPGEPLLLWQPPEGEAAPAVDVDPMLTRWLRPHQREGVQFMFDCVCRLRSNAGQGCILADDMGLGKTLQGIALLWTLLSSGHPLLGGNPVAKRIIIVCPTSLVGNWDSECQKWLKGRPLRTLPLCEASREDVIDSIRQFRSPRNYYQVLILSYETFRIHVDRMQGENVCDLLICDEAHRLKNDATQTNKALDSLACKRRVLLSGTPMQNHLDEFYAMVNFCNPGVLGTPAEFRKKYERPILEGREPGAGAEKVAKAEERSKELSLIVNDFILRRTNSLLSAHLPPKVIEVVCCRMTDLQRQVYEHFASSEAARRMLRAAEGGKSKQAPRVLSAITALKKLCNHPKLIYDSIHSDTGNAAEGFEGCKELFLPGLFDGGRPGRGGMAPGWEMHSGKMGVAARMLEQLRATTNDRIVIVSNYTQTLDMFGVLCRDRNYPVLRLDGSTSISKRQKLVKQFCDPAQKQFVFLLSSKAGGCGLNLVGGNRLLLYDPDWNPATDKQAAGRVWRDGQKKKVYVYRFLTTGTIEEKVYQRQLSKEGLQSLVNNASSTAGAPADLQLSSMSAEELRDLFTLRSHTRSDTYDSICCSNSDEAEEDASVLNLRRLKGGSASGSNPSSRESTPRPSPLHSPMQSPRRGGAADVDDLGDAILKLQVGKPAEEDLKSWGHHSSPSTVPDDIMAQADPSVVSFVFSCQVAGKAIDPEPATPVTQRQSAPVTGANRTCPGGLAGAGTPRSSAPAAASKGPVRAVQSPAATTPAQRQSAPGTTLRRSCLGPGTTPGSAKTPRMSAPASRLKGAGGAGRPAPWTSGGSRRPLSPIVNSRLGSFKQPKTSVADSPAVRDGAD